ncbi:MAG: hypothetical protein ACRD2S_09155 [Terriglobales bacterium]
MASTPSTANPVCKSPVCKSKEQQIDLHRNEAETTNTSATFAEPRGFMTGIWRTLRDYVLWSYERGTIQYDVMVTLILLFIFLSPYWINFKDKPVQRDPHRTEVVVVADGVGGLIYQIDGTTIQGKDDEQVRAELLQIIEPISGKISITRYEADRDRTGKTRTYKVWVRKQ